jgi:hypothetical protein
MKLPLLALVECAIALLLTFPLALLAVYGVWTYADDHDMATLAIAGACVLLGAFIFRAAMKCVSQGRALQA